MSIHTLPSPSRPRLSFGPGAPLVPPAVLSSLVIETGWVGLYKSHRRTEHLIGLLLPGDRIEALTQQGYCHARALTPVVLRIDPESSAENTELDHILRQCIRSRFPALRRLEDVFLEIYERLNKAGLASDWTFSLPLAQREMSNLLGITPVHLSRVMKQLKAKGRIAIQGKMIRLLYRRDKCTPSFVESTIDLDTLRAGQMPLSRTLPSITHASEEFGKMAGV